MRQFFLSVRQVRPRRYLNDTWRTTREPRFSTDVPGCRRSNSMRRRGTRMLFCVYVMRPSFTRVVQYGLLNNRNRQRINKKKCCKKTPAEQTFVTTILRKNARVHVPAMSIFFPLANAIMVYRSTLQNLPNAAKTKENGSLHLAFPTSPIPAKLHLFARKAKKQKACKYRERAQCKHQTETITADKNESVSIRLLKITRLS